MYVYFFGSSFKLSICTSSLFPDQILFSADDEMEDSDGDEDVRRLAGLKTVKKKKHRLGIPV